MLKGNKLIRNISAISKDVYVDSKIKKMAVNIIKNVNHRGGRANHQYSA